MTSLDFNCDIGEGCGDDAAIVPWISSASIACGAHAGDAATMRSTLRLCRDHGVAAGAHPGYADRANFGRTEQNLPPAQVGALVLDQLRRLKTIADEEAVPLRHVKPHGALYNRAARDPDCAQAIAEAVAAFDRSLILYGLSGSALTTAGEQLGLRVAHEVFAERGYAPNGQLIPRDIASAVLDNPAALQQTRALANGRLMLADGSLLRLRADTLCLHGDRPDAAAFARLLREALENSGISVRAPH